MGQVYEKVISLLKQQKKSKLSTYQFFQSLLYGTFKQPIPIQDHNGNISIQFKSLKHYNTYTTRYSQCVLYLHQHHIGILVCVDKYLTGVRNYYNLKNIDILEFHSQYQLGVNGLQKNKYLILKQKHDQTILIFQNMKNRNNFKDNLQKIKKILKQVPDLYDPMILKAFIKADTNQNGEISWNDENQSQFIYEIIHQKNIRQIKNINDIIFIILKIMENILLQELTLTKFQTFQQYLTPKLDVKQFQKFLMNQQFQTEENSKKIINSLYQNKNNSLSFYDFCHYIFGPSNNLLSSEYQNKTEDQQKPLNHYHCYSSHNTYLTGNQISSDSRAQRYLVDLQNGLRCVQIDCHDSNDGPIVKHGYTPTSSVYFKEVIQQIKRFTDLNPNHTPIILSIQNHCNEDNQCKLADILQRIFPGDKIVRISQMQLKQKNKQVKQIFPSLRQCMGKILIKGPGNYELYRKYMRDKDDILAGQFSQDEQGNEVNDNKLIQYQKTNELDNRFNEIKQQFYNQIIKIQKDKQKYLNYKNDFKKVKSNPINMQQMLKINPNQVVQTIIKKSKNKTKYYQQYKVHGKLLSIMCILSKSKLKTQSIWESNSFSQNKIIHFLKKQSDIEEIKSLSLKKWFRSYPDGFRILSSNYDPLPALQLGIQLVAINTQSLNDVNSHILKAFFMKGLNKTTGYRLKKNRSKNIKKNITTKYEIKFISGLRIYQNDQSQNIPPVYVKVYFTGTIQDNSLNEKLRESKQYTQVVSNEAFNPKFNKSSKIQIKCTQPQLGFLIVQVPQCGKSVLPIDCLKPGWRVISLYDDQLKQKQSRLLCYIQIPNHKNNHNQSHN